MGNRVKFNTTLDEDMVKKLKIAAIEDGANVNDLIEEIMAIYLENRRRRKVI